MNNSEMAIVFHLRSVRAKPEPLGTGLRIVGESQIILRDPENINTFQYGKIQQAQECDTQSDDDFNLDNFKQQYIDYSLPVTEKYKIPIPKELRFKRKQYSFGSIKLEEKFRINPNDKDINMRMQNSYNRNIYNYFGLDLNQDSQSFLQPEKFQKVRYLNFSKNVKKYIMYIRGAIMQIENFIDQAQLECSILEPQQVLEEK